MSVNVSRALAVGFLSVLTLGCVGSTTVERGYGGAVVEGRYVSPEAYSAYLRGAIAEADGQVPEALAAYEGAGRRDSRSPEPWARMAALSCRVGGWSGTAAAQIDHALGLEPRYAPAWEIQAQC